MATTRVTGAVVDAFVINATVEAFPVSAAGAVSATCIAGTPATSPPSCATATTDGNGDYTIDLGSYAGAVLLQATGGSYTDTVTGQTVQLPSDLALSVLLPSVGPSASPITAQITALTTIAAQLALQAASQGTALASAAQAADAAVAGYLGGLQSLDTTPLLDLVSANCAAGASQASEDVSLILAGISQLASQYNVSAVSLVLAILQDASDGNLDGALNGVPQSMTQLTGGGSVSLATIYGSGLAQSLEASIKTFEQSAADACQVQQSTSLASGLSNPPSSQLGNSEYSYSLTGSLSGFSGSSPVQATYGVSFSCSGDTTAPPPVTFPLSGDGSFSQTIGGTPSSYASINYNNGCGSNQWSLTVQSPPGLDCTVSPASGSFSSSDAGNTNSAQGSPAISCSAATYTVGGTISGLTASGLVLADQGGYNNTPVTIAANQSSFALTGYMPGETYEIVVQTQPTGQTCSVTNGTGTVGNTDTTNVAVSCQSASAVTETVLWSFDAGSKTDGWNPEGGVAADAAGNLYGTTDEGGANGLGTVFELAPQADGSYKETVLWSFGASGDGGSPVGGIALDSSGNLFGTTNAGGTVNGYAYCCGNGFGTVFELSPQQGGGYHESVLWSFGGANDGAAPDGGVILDSKGNLYGTTTGGGVETSQCLPGGSVFELSPGSGGAYTESLIWSLCDAVSAGGQVSYPDGKDPESQLTLDTSGDLYGTTNAGGANNSGTVFELSPQSGAYTASVLASNAAVTNSSSAAPAAAEGALVEDSAGDIFGTEVQGGSSNYGSVFELVPQAGGGYAKTVLYSFGGSADGRYPYGGLVVDSHGNLYGTTKSGGANGAGIVFELSPVSGGGYHESVLWSFGGPNDGSGPVAGLITDSKGNLYGATSSGGAYGFGAVFRLTTPP